MQSLKKKPETKEEKPSCPLNISICHSQCAWYNLKRKRCRIIDIAEALTYLTELKEELSE